jgi:2,3-bisphosphoglycerate-independent phosphoglycerate mutase
VDAGGKPLLRIADGDYVIFYDVRGEREIELTGSLTDPSFPHFETNGLTARFATMIEYDPKLKTRVAFPPLGAVPNSLSEVVSRAGLRQVKVVESEKAIHLSYFLNGKRDEPFPGEERVFIPSRRDVKNFDECPEMCAAEVTRAIIEKLRDPKYGLIIANYANTDVVGHIEDREAILKAVATVDEETGKVVRAAREAGVTLVITADHGTVEKWYYPDGAVDTGHTESPVPFIIVPPREDAERGIRLREGGSLTDVAPTILDLLGLPKCEEMTGDSLIASRKDEPAGRVMLLILDGWGYREEREGNLIAEAATPVMDLLMRKHPWMTLEAAGEAVGMPAGTVGNSESGHLHLGAGRVIPSDRVRIARAMEDGSFDRNEAFLWAMRNAKRDRRPLHLLGIVSFYSSHGSLDYLYALLDMAKREGLESVAIHGLLGRRGERPESGAWYVDQVAEKCESLGIGKIATMMGRYWALDREENWDRVEKAYRALVNGEGEAVVAE